MKTILLTFCLVAAASADSYDSSLDDFNVAELLGNDRLLMSYSKCILDEGPCTPEVKKVKEKLPEALKTRCAKCTDKQKELGKILAREVKSKHPEIWKKLISKYDPEGKYRESFQDYLKA